MTERLSDSQRTELAAWYWQQIDEAAAACPDDPTGGPHAQALISAAFDEGLTARRVDVGDGVSVPLHELLAPLRARPGGLAETNAAESRRVLDASMAQRRVWWK